MALRRTLLALPYDMVVEIARLVSDDLAAPDGGPLQPPCPTMRAACMEHTVRSRVALEQEESMRWFDHNRYLALVDELAVDGNPEACFMLGLWLVFT
ncbi:unnamed protein product [Miscanthus lutarioriparius]|uniref:Uncharacterized protein n=1 Tax=Miscanthus lutarioriparius TaxID=422564 RepID=A0A811RN87_9POAL|nr:unnamed protein product [Miscanthus lutarioriparius]